MKKGINDYLKAQSGSIPRNVAEELLMLFFGWVPGVLGIAVRAPLWRLLIKGNGYFASDTGVIIKHTGTVEIGNGVFLDRRAYLHGGEKALRIGENTRIMFGASLNVFNYRGLDCSFINIGNNCVISAGCVITGQGGVKIGDDVIMGPHVLVLPVDHNYEQSGINIREQGIQPLPIIIESNVWIGGGAIILGGVTVGSGSVIGAGSVVKENIPTRCLAAGNPAKVIRKLDV